MKHVKERPTARESTVVEERPFRACPEQAKRVEGAALSAIIELGFSPCVSMLRNPNLIPLSHQHQRALALCVRIDRASPILAADLPAWQAELAQIFQSEIAIHFAAEETVLFPVARNFQELAALVNDLLADHAWLSEQFNCAISGNLTADEVKNLAERLSVHIRKEERQLFERLQKRMSAEELNALGKKLEVALKDASQICALRPAKPM
jgi:iron-sulfur cluster repair protein YtfE (RIC family)